MAKDYDISKTSGTCVACAKQLDPGEQFVATIREVDDEFHREDYCPQCWDSAPPGRNEDAPDLFGVWRSCIPAPQEKKRLFVDNELLINFFERLDGTTDEVKVSFRYVLALVLMRKKLLVYDRLSREDDGSEIWEMHFKGDANTHRVIDPKMDAEKIAAVSAQLGTILEGEL
ncbi:MAG: hypothetical protein ACYSTL_08700 [Planctomycetota bacterium]|jgi:hypothetical protein